MQHMEEQGGAPGTWSSRAHGTVQRRGQGEVHYTMPAAEPGRRVWGVVRQGDGGASRDMTGAAGQQQVLDGSNPVVARLRQLIAGQVSTAGWSRCWEEGVTPWDLGQPTPAVVRLVQSGTLPAGDATTVLVPGCGTGYDVVALSSPGRFVVGLDVCETAINKAKQWSAADADDDGSMRLFGFVAADFFAWEPPEPYHLIFDYTSLQT
ncbi:hypothetical protein GUJ93_ZPchr0003g17856 [Zizania palustris]|uniref:Thiol methyltransferase 2 n=1 Tax=Zizania palustris TaxID=103762 RepID=A0A8J5S8Q4_ZIZPA|nr:hypothetical protein GUJ93_ZPchr0003g17856 [Zizania palustris]